MPNEQVKRLTEIEDELTGQRFCTSCRYHQDKLGGKWIISGNGMNRRWKCGGCLKRTAERSSWNSITGDEEERNDRKQRRG